MVSGVWKATYAWGLLSFPFWSNRLKLAREPVTAPLLVVHAVGKIVRINGEPGLEVFVGNGLICVDVLVGADTSVFVGADTGVFVFTGRFVTPITGVFVMVGRLVAGGNGVFVTVALGSVMLVAVAVFETTVVGVDVNVLVTGTDGVLVEVATKVGVTFGPAVAVGPPVPFAASARAMTSISPRAAALPLTELN